jgi:hypothetical protein
VWDYSLLNVESLRALGVKNITFCGLGYTPSLTNIPTLDKDIDVFFYGNLSERRVLIIRELQAKGVFVVASGNIFGEQRDRFIARSKIVLNIHQYDIYIFEIVRVSHLLANKVCVVSESGDSSENATYYENGVAFCSYENLVNTCIALLANPARRQDIAETGFKLFAHKSQKQMVKEALELTFGA